MNRTVVTFVGKIMLRSLALAGTVAVFSSVSANASTISGQFSGSFGAPSGETSDTFVHTGTGSNVLSWGAPSGPSSEVEEGNAASLAVNPLDFDYVPEAGEFLLGTITWVNHSNWHTGGAWDSVLTLSLALDTENGPTVKSVPITLSMVNTTDGSGDTDLNEAQGSTPDQIFGLVFDSGAFDLPIKLGDGLSLTEVLFRLDDAGAPGTGWTSGDGFTYDGSPSGSQFDANSGLWENREGGTSTIGVYGTVSAVPLPAGVWLMLSGMCGFAVVRRRSLKSA